MWRTSVNRWIGYTRVVAIRRGGTWNYYLNRNEIKCKDIAELINDIYKDVQFMSEGE